jgi:uncharacterized Fe-S cluster protein YjdI
MKRYPGKGLEVTFDPARCLHAAECVRGLPAVFDTGRRPWIDPDQADAGELAEVVWRCPSGALHVVGPVEEPDRPTRIDPQPAGPLFVRGDLRIVVAGEEMSETRAALCSCGQSANRPFCDLSGECREGQA